MNSLSLAKIVDVLLLYPGEALERQIRRVAECRDARRVAATFERSLPRIRRWLQRANAAVIDATDDPALATDVFLQAAAQLGADSVAVYAETTHDGLEVFVRARGSLYLFGPLSDWDWTGHFDRLPERRIAVPVAQVVARPAPLRRGA